MPRQNTPIAIAFSDHHYCNWKQFNKNGYRLEVADDILKRIISHATKLNVPILFCGDLIDHPKHLDNEVLKYLSYTLSLIQTPFIGINGNHDQYKVNTHNNPTGGYLEWFSNILLNIVCVDNSSETISYKGHITDNNLKVHGIPYIFGNVDFIEALEARVVATRGYKHNILLLHRDMEGALEPSGKRIDNEKGEDTDEIKRLLTAFDLVLCGHIHKPQQLTRFGDHVYMLGATHQQRRSDMGCEMGYWIIYDDFSLEFVPTKAPEFRYYTDEPENDTDFWIKLPKEEKEAKEVNNEFSLETTTRETLIKRYLIARNQKSKRKLNIAKKYL